MICGTCGRDNAPNLVFCQDCGARLGPRIAPPTPAILPAYDVSAPPRVPADVLPTPSPSRALEAPIDDIDALLDKTKSEPPKEARSRPSAPSFDFSPRDTKGEEQPTRSRCSRCGSSNAPHIRYCLACGNQLRASMGPAAPQSVRPQMLEAAAANPPPESRRDPSQAPKAADQPIAPSPVVGVGTAVAPTSTVRVCSRCRGVCDSTAQFCKFCGASLADATVSSRHHAPPSARDARAEPPPLPPRVAPPPLPPEPPRARASEAPPTPVVPSDVSREQAAASRSVAPAPGTKHRGRLIVIAKDGGEGQSYPIDDRLDIGRSEGDVLVADDGYLSPRHARLAWRGRLILRDLGSVNGVYLRLSAKARQLDERGNAAAPADKQAAPESNSKKLEDQDLILLGQQVIRFEVVKDAEEGLGPASQHGTLVFGTPVAPRYARLCLRTVEGVTRDVYYLGKRETILGRESGDIIFAEDPFLSRRHAAIRVHDADGGPKKRTFSLCDFGSSNGTFVQIRGESPLENGDEFRVGQQLFRVELSS